MSTFYAPTRYLKHHGVKGQQWGVRNGPPYPIEDKVMRKGARISSVSGLYSNARAYSRSGKPMYTYNADDKWDNDVYKGPFSKYLKNRGAQLITEHQYEVVKDLKMPTKQERMDEFKNLINDKKFKKDAINTMWGIQNQLIAYNMGSSEAMKKNIRQLDLQNLKTDSDYKTAYEIFNHAMEAQHYYKSTSEYMRRMSKKYDAMVDDNNQGIYNRAHDPVIIFRAHKVLKPVASQPVSDEYIEKTTNKMRRELKKHGESLKL